jgi:hypothetical protein
MIVAIVTVLYTVPAGAGLIRIADVGKPIVTPCVPVPID